MVLNWGTKMIDKTLRFLLIHGRNNINYKWSFKTILEEFCVFILTKLNELCGTC